MKNSRVLVRDSTFSLIMLPSKNNMITFPYHKATMTFIDFFLPPLSCLYPWVPIPSPSLMVPAPMTPYPSSSHPVWAAPDCGGGSLPEKGVWSFPLLLCPPLLLPLGQPGIPLPVFPKES